MAAYLAHTVCPSRALAHAAGGRFLQGGLPAVAAATETSLQLLCVGRGDGAEGPALQLLSEQPVFASVRAIARVPRPGDQQDWLALLSSSEHLALLRFDADSQRFVAARPAQPLGLAGPARLLTVDQSGELAAVAGAQDEVAVMQLADPAASIRRISFPGSTPLGLAFLAPEPGKGGGPVLAVLLHDQWAPACRLVLLHCSSGGGERLHVLGRTECLLPLPGAAVDGPPRGLVQLPSPQPASLVLAFSSCLLQLWPYELQRQQQQRRQEEKREEEEAEGMQMEQQALSWGPPAEGELMLVSQATTAADQQDQQAAAGGLPEPEQRPLTVWPPDAGNAPGVGAFGSSAGGSNKGGADAPVITCWCWGLESEASHQQQRQQQGGEPHILWLLHSTEEGCVLSAPVLESSGSSSGTGWQFLAGQQCGPPQPHAARCLAILPGGSLLYGCSAGAATEGGPALLESASGVVDCTLADLEGLQQPQLYAACAGDVAGPPSAGRGGAVGTLCTLHPDPRPELVFEQAGAAEGVTGMWGLRQHAADPHHSLVLLSYVNGSRLLATEGGVFRDVSERLPVDGAAQTLAAGNLAAAAAAVQVTAQGVRLFSSAPGGSGGMAWQPPAGSSISAAAVAEGAVLVCCSGVARQLVLLAPAGPSTGSSSSSSGGSQGAQQLEAVATAALPAEASCISNVLLLGGQGGGEALVAVGTYAPSVLKFRLCWGSQQAQQGGQQQQPWLAPLQELLPSSLGAATAATDEPIVVASPQRRQREQAVPESLLLLPAAEPERQGLAGSAGSQAAATSVSVLVGLRTGVLQQVDCSWSPGAAPQQQQLFAVALGSMPVVLLRLPPAGLQQQGQGGVTPPAPLAVALSDRASLLWQPSGAGGRVSLRPLALQHAMHAAPLLLQTASQGGSGLLLPDAADPSTSSSLPEAGAAAAAAAEGPSPQLFLLCGSADGALRLVGLPQQVHLCGMRCVPLGLQPCRLAAHAESGALAVGGTQQQEPEEWEEPNAVQQGAVVHLVEPETGDVLAAFSGFVRGERITAMVVWDLLPAAAAADFAASAAAAVAATAAAALGVPGVGAAPPELAAPQQPLAAPAAVSTSLRSHPIWLDPSRDAASANAGCELLAEERERGGLCLLAVGTSIADAPGTAEAAGWNDDGSEEGGVQGRILLLQVRRTPASPSRSWQGPSQPQLRLVLVGAPRLPSRVLALCTGSSGGGDAGSSGSSSRLFAAVGRRLVSFAYQPQLQLLRKVHWLPTLRPPASLQMSPSGLLAAADRAEGVTLYRYRELLGSSGRSRRGTAGAAPHLAPPGAAQLQHAQPPQQGQQQLWDSQGVGFALVAADTCCRAAVGALPLPPLAAPAVTAGVGQQQAVPSSMAAAAAAVVDAWGVLTLVHQQRLWHEAAVHPLCSHALQEAAAALLPGSLRFCNSNGSSAGAAGGAEGKFVAVTAEGSVVALRALPQAQAQQLLQLQHVLAEDPLTAPLCGGSHAQLRASPGPVAPKLFEHPQPGEVAAAQLAGAGQSPPGPQQQQQEEEEGEEQEEESLGTPRGGVPAPQQPSPSTPEVLRRLAEVEAAAAAATVDATLFQEGGPRGGPQQVNAILDGDLLAQFLLLPPAQQRRLAARAAGGGGREGSEAALHLTNLLMQLLQV